MKVNCLCLWVTWSGLENLMESTKKSCRINAKPMIVCNEVAEYKIYRVIIFLYYHQQVDIQNYHL